MSDRQVEQLLASGESERVVFKSAQVEPSDIGQSVCALLNSEGGAVFWGVDDHGSPQLMTDAEERANRLREYLQKNLSPEGLWSVTLDNTSRGKVITTDVPIGRDRPYVCDGTIYVRTGADTRKATAEQIQSLMRERYIEARRWERRPSPELEMSDLEAEEIRKMISDASRDRTYQFSEPEKFNRVLTQLGMMVAGQITNAADVLFAKNPAIRLPQTRARATVFTTDKGGSFLDSRIFEGPAGRVINDLFEFVTARVGVTSQFRKEQLKREDKPQYPSAALREGLVNALVHRDYAGFDGGVSVSLYPDRLEIWNSGQLPEGLTISDLKKDHPSLPQNPDIAHVFYLRGFMERVGRGTQKIIEECRALGIPTPTWKSTPAGVTLVFHSKKITANAKPLNPRQRNLLTKMEAGAVVKPSDYYGETKDIVSQRQAQRDLTELESGGWLRRDGSGPSTAYVRTEKTVG